MIKSLKRVLSIILTVALVIGLMPRMSLTAYAAEFSTLQAGDVLHVGDTINSTTEYKVGGNNFLNPNFKPWTLVRANVNEDTVTEAENGSHYLFKGTFKGNPIYLSSFTIAATDASDGISVTSVGLGSNPLVSFAVHEAPTHTHSFTYSVNGATITATCNADGCTLDDGTEQHKHAVTLTIVKPTLTTYGQTGEGISASATLTGLTDFNTATGLNVQASSIIYWNAKIREGVYKTDGDQPLTAAPTSAGNYLAKITVNNCIAAVGYTINKADPTAPTGLIATYGQKLSDVALPTGWTWADSTQSVGSVVSPAATFKANFAENDNYNAASDVDVTVTVSKANAVPATVTANSRTYDGTEKPLVTVTGEATGGEMQYALGNATEATQPYTTSIPTATDAGTYNVWFMIKGDDTHNDIGPVCISGIEIARFKPVLSWGNTTLNYTGEKLLPEVTIQDMPEGDDVVVELTGAGIDIGYYTAEFAGLSGEDAGNYEEPTDNLSKIFSIVKNSSEISVSIEDWTYGDKAKSPVVTGVPEGKEAVIEYKPLDGNTFTEEIPTEVGKYTVRATLAGDDTSDTVSAEYNFTIAPKEVTIVWGKTEFVYNGKNQIPTVELKGVLETDSEYVEADITGESKTVGSHTARVIGLTGDAASNYKLPANAKKVFTISKADLPRDNPETDPFVYMSSWVYGDKPMEPHLINNISGGTVTYSYILVTWEMAQEIVDLMQNGTKEEQKEYINSLEFKTAKPVNAGSYIVRADIAATVNYNELVLFNYFSIEEREAEFDWGETSFVYDGELHIPECKVANLVSGDECDVIVKVQRSEPGEYSDGESEVGEYKAEVLELTNHNYILPESDEDIFRQFTISEQPLSITVSIEDWIYGDYTSSPIIRGNKGAGAESFTYYLDEECTMMTTSDDGAETDGGIPSFAGKYYVKANVEATEIYTAAEATAEFTIGKRKLEIGWDDTEFIYDGKEHVPAAYAFNPAYGDNIEFIVSGAGINAGKYEAEAFIADGMLAENYEIPERMTQEFTIAKKEAELKWGETEFIYNGHDQLPTVEVINLEEGDNCIPVVAGAATAVGEHKATVVRLSNSNYELPENIEMDFTIVKADIPGYESDDPVMVEIDDWNYGDEPETPYLEGYTGGGTVRYSYLEITPKIMDDFMELDVGGASREEILAYINGLSYTTAIPKNAGFYILRADIDATENYNESVRFCSFIIFPKPVEVEWGETTFEYDGEEHVPDCKVVGLINGDECDVMVDGAEIEVGDKYEAEVTGLTNPNYEPVDDFSQTFSIIKAHSDISVYIDDWTYGEEGFNPECEDYDGDGEVIYTYYKDTECTQKTTKEDGAGVEGGKPSFAGGYVLEAYVAETDHYEECRDTVYLFIDKREAGIEWSKDSFVYNGKEQAPEAVVINPAEGDKVELIVSGAGTDAGKYVAEAKFADETVERNYFITKGDETKAFEITKKVAELSWGETEFVYNGEDQIPEVSVSNLEDGDNCNLTVTGEATAVGKHKATVIKLSNKNYELPDEIQKEFNIVKADLTDVSVSLDGWVYDESPKVPVVEGNIEGANVTYKYKAADADDSAYTTTVPSNAGDYTVMAVIDATAGYNKATVTADFTIDKAKSKVVKKPVPREDAVFMGCDQALIIEGEAFGGKIIYAHGDSNTEAPEDDSYFDEMPVEYDAGVHYVWYLVNGDANHYDTEPECLEVTIAPKEATITCNSADKVYGEEDPELTAVDEGFIGYYAPEYEVVREEGNDVGEYVITVEIEEDTNYDLTIVEGTFTISKKAAVIKAEDKTRTYGEEDPELTAVVEGVLDGDELNYTLKRKPGNTIGTYAITVKPGDNPNYEVTTERATFTIEKGKATITADDITKKVGQADPELTATVEGVAKGDALSYALQRKEGNTPGTYEIKVIPGVNRNYDVTAVNGTFTILDELPFVDVPVDSYYYESVYWAVEQEPQITSGVDETHFKPMGTCTRAQVVTFLWRANGCPEPNTSDNPFTDVSEEDFYYQAVLWAVEKGITAGKTATTFAPNDPCTRAQVVSFLWRDAGSPEPSLSESPFTDVTEESGYYKAVLWAVENGITNGINANEFGVKKTCIRAQIVTFIMRAYGTK